MAHQAADGTMWTNASQAAKRKAPAAKQPSKSPDDSGNVDITQDGDMFVVTARFATQQEAEAAAQALSGSDDSQPSQDSMSGNPASAMM